jgi:lipoprotein NlpI
MDCVKRIVFYGSDMSRKGKTAVKSICTNLSFVLVLVSCLSAIAQDNSGEKGAVPVSPDLLRAMAVRSLQAGESVKAVEAVDKLLAQLPNDPGSLRLAGDVYLRSGKSKKAAVLFDRYLKLEPDALAGLWQRGIALYFARDYKGGVEQFEVHRRVNPNDVENAAWHFLCVAKAQSFEKAKAVVLPAPNDPRAPMEEVLQMLSTGDTAKVTKKMESFPPNTRLRESADFYGNFYLGLYADAAGDRAKAKRYLDLAAKDASFSYMGDVARVYATYLSTEN